MSELDTYEETVATFDLQLPNVRWGCFGNPSMPGWTGVETVFFVQTTLNLALDADQRLAQGLAPVREILDTKALDFQSLMQRDLDDFRVCHDLIPYLLREEPGSFRMFPSILVALLPAENSKLLDRYYPIAEGPYTEGEKPYYGFRSEAGGRVAWSLRLRKAGESVLNEGARLDMNSQWCRLAIIDGQHRAMALLALARNKSAWPLDGQPFKHFYSNYKQEGLAGIRFEQFVLPITLCLFPGLHQGNLAAEQNKFRVVEAVRRLFLDVNREARAPSRARQVLLDDRDVVSDFVRSIIQEFQQRPDGAPGLHLWNVYLDQPEDQESSMPPVAITTVLHVDNVLTASLLCRENDKTCVSFKDIAPNYRGNQQRMKEVLQWSEHFGKEETSGWRSDRIPRVHRAAVVSQFASSWGRQVRGLYDTFWPYQALAIASQGYKSELEQDPDLELRVLRRLLFEGHGMRSVQREFAGFLRKDVPFVEDLPKFNFDPSAREDYKKKAKLLENAEAMIVRRAARAYWRLAENPPAESIVDEFTGVYQRLMDNVFRTKAFQVGVQMGLVHIETMFGGPDERALMREVGFEECYWKVLSAYFDPRHYLPSAGGKQQETSLAADYLKELRVSRMAAFDFVGSKGKKEGLYALLREVLGELRESKWTRFKYVAFESFASEWPDVVAIRQAFGATSAKHQDVLNRAMDVIQTALDGPHGFRQHLVDAVFVHHKSAKESLTNMEVVGEELQALRSDTSQIVSRAIQHATARKITVPLPEFVQETVSVTNGDAECTEPVGA